MKIIDEDIPPKFHGKNIARTNTRQKTKANKTKQTYKRILLVKFSFPLYQA